VIEEKLSNTLEKVSINKRLETSSGPGPALVLYVKYPRKTDREREIEADILHQSIGHFGFAKEVAFAKAAGYKILGPKGTLESAKQQIINCEPCMIGKSKALPRFAVNRVRRASKPGAMLHLDTQGPWRVRSRTGKLYKFSVTDDYSAYTADFYLAHKNEFIECLRKAISFFETQTGNKVQEIVCDQEFTAPREVTDRYSGVIWKDAATGDKNGNPLAERMNQTTGGPARAMRYQAGFPPSFWDEMEHTASTLWNILPATTGPRQGITPYEQLLGRKPPMHQLKPIGSQGVMHQTTSNGKGSMPGKLVTLVGYDIHRELYRVWDGQRVIAGVRNARFDPRKVGPLKEKKAQLSNVLWNDESEGERKSRPISETLTHEDDGIEREEGSEATEAEKEPDKEEWLESGEHTTEHTQSETHSLGGHTRHLNIGEDNNEKPDTDSTFQDTQHTIREDIEQVTREQEAKLTETDMSLGPTINHNYNSPSVSHASPHRYVESAPPVKGLTWEQSHGISTTNIVSGKRIRKQTDLANTSTHHVTVSEIEESISRGEESEWLFYLHLPTDLKEEGMSLQDLQKGIEAELKALRQFQTYEWVSAETLRRTGIKPVGLLWVHKVKTDESGSKFVKSRLSLRGDQLVPGISYNPDQLYVPCANHRSVLLVFKLAVNFGHTVYGVDFKNAYLNADMKDPVYARPPQGTSERGREGSFWKISKALYGAPQAGKRWYDLFADLLKKLGYNTLKSDPCMFVQHGVPTDRAIIGVFHVDDLIFIAPSRKAYQQFCDKLEEKFPIKRLGIAKEFKGMEIEQKKGEIILHQRIYTRKVIKFFGYVDCKPSATPGSRSDPMPMHAEARLRQHSIPQIVGSLLFLAKMTRPDIDEAVNAASVLQTVNEGVAYAKLGKCIRYIKNLRGLRFRASPQKESPVTLTVWPDAAHRTCLKTGKSRTGYLVLCGGDPISWLSKRQSKVALSSNDAEIFAANEALRETMAIRHTLQELGIAQRQPIEVFEDNAQTILAAQRGLSGSRTKHLPLEQHYLNELERDKIVVFCKVGTKDQLADVMTKYIPKEQQENLLDRFTIKLTE